MATLMPWRFANRITLTMSYFERGLITASGIRWIIPPKSDAADWRGISSISKAPSRPRNSFHRAWLVSADLGADAHDMRVGEKAAVDTIAARLLPKPRRDIAELTTNSEDGFGMTSKDAVERRACETRPGIPMLPGTILWCAWGTLPQLGDRAMLQRSPDRQRRRRILTISMIQRAAAETAAPLTRP